MFTDCPYCIAKKKSARRRAFKIPAVVRSDADVEQAAALAGGAGGFPVTAGVVIRGCLTGIAGFRLAAFGYGRAGCGLGFRASVAVSRFDDVVFLLKRIGNGGLNRPGIRIELNSHEDPQESEFPITVYSNLEVLTKSFQWLMRNSFDSLT